MKKKVGSTYTHAQSVHSSDSFSRSLCTHPTLLVFSQVQYGFMRGVRSLSVHSFYSLPRMCANRHTPAKSILFMLVSVVSSFITKIHVTVVTPLQPGLVASLAMTRSQTSPILAYCHTNHRGTVLYCVLCWKRIISR